MIPMVRQSNCHSAFQKGTWYLIFGNRLGWKLMILILSFIAACFGILAPYFQKKFIDHLQGVATNDHPVQLIILAFICLLFGQLLYQFTQLLSTKEALIAQNLIGQKIYHKILNLRADSISRRSMGEIVSLYSTDAPGATIYLEQTLPQGASTLFPLLIAPFAIWKMVNIPLMPTLFFMFLFSAINTTLAFRQSRFFFNFKQLAAERAGLVVEWIQNMRVLRILNWMIPFESRIFDKRKIETKNRVQMVTNGQVMNAISSSVTFFINAVAIYTFIQFKTESISSSELFALLWILGVFLTRPFRQMPWFFTFAFDAWTSMKRIQQFLSIENKPIIIKDTEPTPKNKIKTVPAIEIKNLNLQIDHSTILENIDLTISEKEFIAIIGEVGSGKSMLLLSLLGETGFTANQFRVFGNADVSTFKKHFAFVPQEGFIMSASLRENVQFQYDCSHDQDEHIRRSLLKAQFGPDLVNMNGGLDSIIGERGVNLSGGQRQRVSLARVTLADAPIVLLDDCLSAVDIDTEHKLVNELLLESWKDKTRIIATHRLSILEKVDRIIFLADGKIKAIGSFDELAKSCPEFNDFRMTHERN